jgi:hypothetical protein
LKCHRISNENFVYPSGIRVELHISLWNGNLIFENVCKIEKGNFQLCHVFMSVCLFAWNILAPLGRISIKIHLLIILENLFKKFNFH